MEFMIVVAVLFVLSAARLILDMKATSSNSADSEASRPRISIEDEDDAPETYEDAHPPVELPELGRSSASTLSSYYD